MSNDRNSGSGFDLSQVRLIHSDLPTASLVETSLRRGESALVSTGALCAQTGARTGRSPNDKFIVQDPEFEGEIWWGKVNRPIAPEVFGSLLARVADHLRDKEVFVFNGFAGADLRHRLPVRIITERAWHSLFSRQLFIRPTIQELANHRPAFTVVSAPGFKAVPDRDGTASEAFILVSFAKKMVLIGGTEYAGEIKKSIFSVMNYLMPGKGVAPMHCSANVGREGDTALFFGLSGTGKTTLSADPNRSLIGDDEHGWSDSGVFNFEGGCYAKCIHLSEKREPQIWRAIRFGAVVENVHYDKTSRIVDYDRSDKTENTRVAYPIDYIPGAVIPGIGGHPRTIIFLTADAYGILPPISKLDRSQTMYHFISGYTSKLAGTETGVKEPQATFSACFGSPFLPLHPQTYAHLLAAKIEEHESQVYLVNTGWTGGPYGEGQRIRLDYTRAMVTAALSGQLSEVPYQPHPVLRIAVPQSCPGVPSEVLDPRSTWKNPQAYNGKARELARLFVQNIQEFENLDPEILEAGPHHEE